jgi:hypothetical protein
MDRAGRNKLRDEYEIIWSGKTTEKTTGPAIIVNPTYAEMVTDSQYISGSVMKIRILVKEKEMNVLQIHAPQTGCSNEENKEFKEILKDNINREYIYIMEDFKAQIGKDRNGYKTIMGPHKGSSRNSEGENLLDM